MCKTELFNVCFRKLGNKGINFANKLKLPISEEFYRLTKEMDLKVRIFPLVMKHQMAKNTVFLNQAVTFKTVQILVLGNFRVQTTAKIS